MSFEDAEVEIRERLVGVNQLLNHIATIEAADGIANSENIYSLRGLWVVAIYGVFERALNVIVEQALSDISMRNVPSCDCTPEIHSIFHHGSIQSVKDCSYNNVFDKSVDLFKASSARDFLSLTNNPLAKILQNVDGNTVIKVFSYFGETTYVIDQTPLAKLSHLRERRNAVAHGREAAARVGERLNISDLRSLYGLVDAECFRFIEHMKQYCYDKRYVLSAA